MTNYTYVLSYPRGADGDENKLRLLIAQNRDIESWYQPFEGTYIVKSEMPLHALSDQFRYFFAGGFFSLTHVVPQLMGGALPPAIWDWVNNITSPGLTSK